ncbi:MAG: YraN family protein [Planctomycetaceae bacterium]|nr:YraN family protein [Planctomycetaceae bacterium]
MTRHLELGESGEAMAVRYLINKGLTIVDTRVRFRRGELDIVARQGREWVFVEVKTRSGTRMGTAAEAFTATKAKRMQRAVTEYVRRHGLENEAIRCDLVAIDFAGGDVPEISHFPGGITWT